MTVTKNYAFLQQLTDRLISGDSITADEAKHIISLKTQEEIVMLMAHATVLKNLFKGLKIDLCSVVNAKSGRCTEDCIFCAQSAHHKTEVKTYPLLDAGELVRSAHEAHRSGANRFGLVTSGKGIASTAELDTVSEALEEISQKRLLCHPASTSRQKTNCLLSLVCGRPAKRHTRPNSPARRLYRTMATGAANAVRKT